MRFCFFILFFIFSHYLLAQSIYLDEDFSDWSNAKSSFADKKGDGNSSGIDFTDVRISNDENYLFLFIDISKEINIQSNNKLTMYIDTDNQSSTGLSIYGIGADLVYTFGSRGGQGFTTSTNSKALYHNNLGLITSPTVTSDKFEIGILRRYYNGTENITMKNLIRIVLTDDSDAGDRAPDATGGYLYEFDNVKRFVLSAFSIQKEKPEYLRIVSYNVQKDNIFKASVQQNYRRIFKATNPDIIGFCEIYESSPEQVAALVETHLPSTGNQKWYYDGVSPDIRLVSRYPIINSRAIDGNGAFLLDLGKTKLLYIVAHLPCCDSEVLRQREADNIMAFVRSVKFGISPLNVPLNTPIVISGDMNFVGLRSQQQTLITGDIVYKNSFGPNFDPDWDGSKFVDVKPITTNIPSNFTWYSELGSYSAGRLDYFIYSGSVMTHKNSFALWTPTLTTTQLNSSGLLKNDVIYASDHAPIVCDFEIPGTFSSVNNENSFSDFSVQQLNGQYIIKSVNEGKIIISDISGRNIYQGYKSAYTEELIIEADCLPLRGLYVITFVTDHRIYSEKILH